MQFLRRTALALILVSICHPAVAYNPPTDTAGPLSVRIEGPAEVTAVGTPAPVKVLLDNKGDGPLQGTIELAVVDRWKIDPVEKVEFSVDGRGTVTKEFTVTAGEGTYSAHYPIHAYVRFVAEGQEFTAHPILILETKLPRVPRAEPGVEWKPFAVGDNRELALWRLPLHRSVIQVFNQPPQTTATGWQGRNEETYGHFQTQSHTLGQESREVLAVHPPWRDGKAGTLVVEYPLRLPATRPLKLAFANAISADSQGDGVTFRVRVVPFDAPPGQLGQIVFERHTDAKHWESHQADLSRLAGRAIRLQLESHPGPKNNTGWDQSFWAEPTLIAGTPQPPAPFPPTDSVGSIGIGKVRCGEGEADVRFWPGKRGLLDAVIGFSYGGRQVFFRGFELRVLGGRIDDARSPMTLGRVQAERIEGGYAVRHPFQGPRGAFDLVGELAIESGVLRARFRLENVPQPEAWQVVYLEDVAAGPWSQTAKQVYAGHGHVVREPQTYSLSFDGHRLATSFVGMDFEGGLSMVQGVDVPPTAFEVRPPERHYSLHAAHASTFTFILSENAFGGAKVWRDVNQLKAAGGVEKAAGRFVFDLWGGRYKASADALARSFRYGLGDSMVVWHNWQRWGYDYRLPDIYPPNPQLGRLEEMQELARVCRAAGTIFAPHDNYIDFYPDADGFSYEKLIAFHREGQPVRAWLNEGRNAQSYRYRADQAEPFLKRNLELIKGGLAPTGFFIDVWSSAPPYDYWTADGKYFDRVYTRNTWGELFAWIREYLGDSAPQISESGHDQLIGWLDGAQTNHLRVGEPIPGSRHGWTVINWKCGDAERTPWFDAAHHDRFILHGAGYSSRYEGGLDRRLHGIYSDDYIATEVLTGHPAMVSEPFGRDVVRKHWLLNDLMRALALSQVESVEYVGDDLHRQHVGWSGGGNVWVNRGETDWEVEGRVLPPFGFLARVPGEQGAVEASIERRGELIVESVRAPQQIYVNGRLIAGELTRIEPAAEGFRQMSPRSIEVGIVWRADDPIPDGYRPFLHLCDAKGEIVSQLTLEGRPFENSRQGEIRTVARGSLPDELESGTELELRAGLYDPNGPRLALMGADDGERRIRLGKVKLEAPSDGPTRLLWTPQPEVPNPMHARQNPRGTPVDFGAVVTAGGIRLMVDGDSLLLTPLPGERVPEFEVRLNPAQLPWRIGALARVESLAEDGSSLASEAVRRDGEAIVITCRPGVFQYRLGKE